MNIPRAALGHMDRIGKTYSYRLRIWPFIFVHFFCNPGDIFLFPKSYHLNCDWELQLFCGMLLEENERIRDNSIVSRICSYIGEHADLDQVQRVMLEHWK